MSDETITPYAIDNSPSPKPELSTRPIDYRPLIAGALVALTFFIAAILCGWWLFVHPVRAVIIRDIFIIYVGLGIFVLIPLLIVLIVALTYVFLKLNDLKPLLDREIRPMLMNMNNSINTVRGTTTFLSDHAVQPVISTVSTVTAIRVIISSLFRRR